MVGLDTRYVQKKQYQANISCTEGREAPTRAVSFVSAVKGESGNPFNSAGADGLLVLVFNAHTKASPEYSKGDPSPRPRRSECFT